MQDATKGIAGHEGAGEVVKAADDVADIWKVGDRAGVKWVVRNFILPSSSLTL